jgi:hypothetical protein
MLRVANAPPRADLSAASSALVATPLVLGNGTRSGTFELWHRRAEKPQRVALRRSTPRIMDQSQRSERCLPHRMNAYP